VKPNYLTIFNNFKGIKINIMLRYALIFFVIALISGVLGFGGIAAGASSIAQILFGIFVILFVVSIIMHFVRRV